MGSLERWLKQLVIITSCSNWINFRKYFMSKCGHDIFYLDYWFSLFAIFKLAFSKIINFNYYKYFSQERQEHSAFKHNCVDSLIRPATILVIAKCNFVDYCRFPSSFICCQHADRYLQLDNFVSGLLLGWITFVTLRCKSFSKTSKFCQ